MPATGKIENLPRWAQSRIELLTRQLAEARNDAHEARSPHPGSNVVIHHGIGDDGDQTLPPNSRITFKFGPDTKWYQDITVHHEGECLVIHGGGSLQIYPHVTNLIRVKVEER